MKLINMADDSHVPPPPEMSALLADLSKEAKADYYGQGGAVEAFETQVARFLGKERAVMFPTGTLGNQLTLQRLTGGAPVRCPTLRAGRWPCRSNCRNSRSTRASCQARVAW